MRRTPPIARGRSAGTSGLGRTRKGPARELPITHAVGLDIALRGGPNAERQSAVAVVHKLAVLQHALWKGWAPYTPLLHADALDPRVGATAAIAVPEK